MSSRKVLILDSTQLQAWFECPERHTLEFVENLAQSNEINKTLAAGTYGHKLLEIYYKHENKQVGTTEALKFWPEPNYPLDKETEELVRNRFLLYCMNYNGKDVTPLIGKKHHLVIENGLPVDKYSLEPLVEQGFSYELLNTKEYLFVLEGRIDIAGSLSGNNLFVDHKWQFRERNLYHRSIQFKNYSLVTGFNLGLINYIGLQKTVNDNTFRREALNFTSIQIREWKEELTEMYIKIANNPEHERRWSSCEGKFGYSCPFTPLCDVYKHPELYQIIKQRYVKKEEWKPW